MSSLQLPDILMVRVGDLRPWGENPKEHDPEQLDRLGRSLKEFGFGRPIVVQSGTLRILAGHGIHAALMAAGHAGQKIPVAAMTLNDEDAAAYTVADNRLAELSTWWMPALRDHLGELDNGVRDMLAVGWSDKELLALFGQPVELPDALCGLAGEAPEFFTVEVHGDEFRVDGTDREKKKRIEAALKLAGWRKG